ncbi:hypothetical protein FNV43_RR19194 [Rhamnella rubrinervis]|uniref:Uncharacterized protein n=1 Tax=Rhamnella rubrinervis TaxID=2594499 RepID=A0A8K0GX00_9ROSA|nr:hypothetical protein FNV43_RR19194 [Rhamnella rubrinervis]
MRSHGSSRGFRLNPKRFSVSKLRARFICLFRLLRCSYGKALQSLRRSMSRSSSGNGNGNMTRNNSSRRSLMTEIVFQEKGRRVFHQDQCRFRSSLGRSNSFYAEAIADCLEFIKRSSISVDQNQVVVVQRQD